ncbi:hypothetical protein C8A00DRAFT_35404 [Chaetomidium leptoderma]|uniref:Uncharacterized protein n=1 Tax=Chaetomidium leptoderma TaxID=669021 RepID=A0AAN6VIJ6_9PEZI|nr:hypothetical protein C8A00DRAFT_35404 [Chaetomidium leptoderma]
MSYPRRPPCTHNLLQLGAPPPLILRLHYLDRLSATVQARAATIQANLTTTKLAESYLSQKAEPPQTTTTTTENPEPEPDWLASLFETWKRQQLLNPFLARRAYASARRHHLLTTNPPNQPSPTATATACEEKEEEATPATTPTTNLLDQTALHHYLLARHARLALAQAELTRFRTRNASGGGPRWWKRRAHTRAKDYLKARDARHSKWRDTGAKWAVAYYAHLMGLRRRGEFGAHSWG